MALTPTTNVAFVRLIVGMRSDVSLEVGTLVEPRVTNRAAL